MNFKFLRECGLWHGARMPKKPPTKAKRKPKKTDKRDFSQIALAVAERATGSKLIRK